MPGFNLLRFFRSAPSTDRDSMYPTLKRSKARNGTTGNPEQLRGWRAALSSRSKAQSQAAETASNQDAWRAPPTEQATDDFEVVSSANSRVESSRRLYDARGQEWGRVPQDIYSVRGTDAVTVMSMPRTMSEVSLGERTAQRPGRQRSSSLPSDRYYEQEEAAYAPAPRRGRPDNSDQQTYRRETSPRSQSSHRSPERSDARNKNPGHRTPQPERRSDSAHRDRDQGSGRREHSHENSKHHASSCRKCRSATPTSVTYGPNGQVQVHVDEGTKVRIGNDTEGYMSWEEYTARERSKPPPAPPTQYYTVPLGPNYVFLDPTGREVARIPNGDDSASKSETGSYGSPIPMPALFGSALMPQYQQRPTSPIEVHYRKKPWASRASSTTSLPSLGR